MNDNLVSYYDKRAEEYDAVYEIAHEREDIRTAERLFQELFAGKTVLEIACGTGYWTHSIAQTAAQVVATDRSQRMITLAKKRTSYAHVQFEVVDMYSLETDRQFDGIFGGFIWSHILHQDVDSFLDRLAGLCKQGGVIAFIDSREVPGAYHDPSRTIHTDDDRNTYQTRTLADGSSHLVLKNFPTRELLIEKLSRIATNCEVVELENFWIATCMVRK